MATATADRPPAAPDPQERLDLLLRDLGTRRARLSTRVAAFPVLVWGSAELRRWVVRRHGRR